MELQNACKSPEGTRYWRQGQGIPLVLIHGVGLDATMWQAQVEALSAQFDVIAYDMLGHGDSPLPGENDGLDAYAQQLTQLLDHLAIERACVLGFSMGGLVARAFALQAPSRLEALVILSSVFERNEEQKSGVYTRIQQVREQGPSANIEGALKRWFSPAYHDANPDVIASIYQTVCQNDPQGYYRSYLLFGTQDNYGNDRLAEISIPVLIATGELDPGSTPEMASQLALKLPNAEVHIFPGQRHMVPVESADMVNRLIQIFLAKAHSQTLLEETH